MITWILKIDMTSNLFKEDEIVWIDGMCQQVVKSWPVLKVGLKCTLSRNYSGSIRTSITWTLADHDPKCSLKFNWPRLHFKPGKYFGTFINYLHMSKLHRRIGKKSVRALTFLRYHTGIALAQTCAAQWVARIHTPAAVGWDRWKWKGDWWNFYVWRNYLTSGK